ncbi:HAD family hydrolase [Sporosalibacterium faouarense]|uniref:HAD family hydrolase n=1 Tax=Sporosalibacterium faouarense TaxID=516123 RepID=UPI00192AD571|nr:HAD family hydrolase [Sporosalibacterium faouarense]
MIKPKMIIFDYGQTLINEKEFDVFAGTKAVLLNAAKNPNNISVKEIQGLATELNKEIGRYVIDLDKESVLEVHNHIFQKYLYEYFDIELTKPHEEVERIFEKAAISSETTKNIENLLFYLNEQKIRTSVISNISFSGSLLKEKIDTYIPNNNFEFIIASSEYVFRKPHKRIFQLALRKAKLAPRDVWYCGDNAVCDVDGASNCRIFPVWYKGAIKDVEKKTPQSNHLEIYDWFELRDILERIS